MLVGWIIIWTIMILYIHASCQIIHFTTSILATLESILHQQPKWPFDNISQISHSHFLTLPMALTTLRIKPRNIPQLTGPYMVHRTTPPALHSGPSASFLHPVHILGSLLLFLGPLYLLLLLPWTFLPNTPTVHHLLSATQRVLSWPL